MSSQEDLFAKVLMVEEPWFVDKVQFDQAVGKLEIWIDFERGSIFYYEDKELGIKGHFNAYDTTHKTWRHLNFFQYQCYLHAWIPGIDIGDGKVRQVQSPWERHAAGFTRLLEALIIELVKVMPVHQVCQLLRVYDSKLWKMIKAYTETARACEDFSSVEVVGVDEKAVRKGHDYVSLFVDLEEKRTIFVTEGRDNEVVADFINKMNIALKEANETDYWLDLLKATGYLDYEKYFSLSSGIKELLKMLISTVKTVRLNS